ncbi:MAG: HRDC domain-containing protein [Myxococcota bacterium]|jgi:ribonuclease D|nr:HRDC domain-containing protein [Myxococcota bacterium]
MNHEWRYIADDAGLVKAVADIEGATVLGIDTEADSFFHYQEQVCLIQLTAGQLDLIIDPLAVEDLSLLAPIFADPNVVKVLHGADYDIASLKRDYDFQVSPVFDTMLASQALGYKRYSLADLVARFFDVKLEKKYQRRDWSKRPLREEHLLYARLDSHFLPRLRELLWAEVVEADREEQVLEECRLVEKRERPDHSFNPDDFLRIRGAGRLDDRGKRVLRALYVMRDGMARERDRPHFKVIGNDALLKIAAYPPRSVEELTSLLGKKHHVVRRFSEPVVQACREGLADRAKVPRSRPDPRPTRRLSKPDETRLFEVLRTWRNKAAKERGVEAGVLMSNAVLQEIAASKIRSKDDLRGIEPMRDWQRTDFADDIVALIADLRAAD